MEIGLGDEVRDLVRLGVLLLRECRVGDRPELLDQRIQERTGRIREAWSGRAPGEIPELRAARRLYRSAGLDPTRNRPSSEALIRRILRGGGLPRINSAVDLCNLAAITYYLPIGLYDLDRIEPPVTARLGGEDEWYEGLGKPRVNLAGRFCLEDRRGPFGNPSSDSRRSAVDPGTNRLLWVIYAPCEYDEAALTGHLEWSADQARQVGLCRTVEEPVLIPGEVRR